MDNSRNSRDVQISKALSYLLRHGAEKEGLRITKGSIFITHFNLTINYGFNF